MLAILLLLAPILAAPPVSSIPGSVSPPPGYVSPPPGYVSPPPGQTGSNSTQSAKPSKTSYTFPPPDVPTYANSNPKPTAPAPTYAAAYSDLESLLPSDLSSRTWGNWVRSANSTASDASDPYGEYAWTQLWDHITLYNYSDTSIYSTTVEPTPLPSSTLVLPPDDIAYFDDGLQFPEDFVFGVAGSAAQIEGAFAQEGRAPSIQEITYPADVPQDYITNENYYLYKEDIMRLASMGVKHYSFTIPWSRILPFSQPGTPVNTQAIDHYDDLINTCLEYGITPMVTLTHFDTPTTFVNEEYPPSDLVYKSLTGSYYPLYNNGGYWNETFVEAFVNYGKIVMTHYADRVPLWVVFNEPGLYSAFPMGVKNVINATAQMHKFYHEEIKGTGKVGIKFNNNFGMPKNSSNPDDVAAANRAQEFYLGSFANPLFKGENYPQSWIDTFTSYNGTLDPENNFLFTDDELKEVSFRSDFFGIDPYTYSVITPPDGGVEQCQNDTTNPLWPYCVNSTSVRSDGWTIGYRSQSYVYITPVQFREFLNYLWITFKTPILIGEFGFPEWREAEKELGDQLFDDNRSTYYRTFLDSILKAIHYDDVKVLGAFAWSFADNWEFTDYSQQFGFQVVNRTTQERFYKKSFFDTIKYVEDRLPGYNQTQW